MDDLNLQVNLIILLKQMGNDPLKVEVLSILTSKCHTVCFIVLNRTGKTNTQILITTFDSSCLREL